MPETASRTKTARETDRAVSSLNRSLRRLHVSRADRHSISDDVRGDLEAAAAEGVSPWDLIGPDVDAFARQATEARGFEPMSDDYPRILFSGTAAAAVGVPAVYLLLMYVVHPLFVTWFDLDGDYPTAGPVLAYAFMVLTGTGIIIAALNASLSDRLARRRSFERHS